MTHQLLYGPPAGDRLSVFPAMAIGPNGGFDYAFNVTAPPPFVCSGGAAAMGSRFLYVSLPPDCSNESPQIIGYSLDQVSGAPTALYGSPFSLPASAIPQGMAMAPNSNLLYVADAAGSIDVFAVDSVTGLPTEVRGSPFKSGTNYQLVIDPSGKYLYASEDDGPGGVLAFTIDSDGALTPVPGSPFLMPGTTISQYGPVGIVDTGKYIYVALSETNQIAGFSIDSETGALSLLPSSPVATGNGPGPLVLVGNFLYTVNQLDGTITGYTINADTGALTTIPGSPFGSDGWGLVADISGRFLYLSTFKAVQGFNIDPATGALNQGEGKHGVDGVLWLTVVAFGSPTLP